MIRNTGYQNISPEELRGMSEQKRDFLLLDVRTPMEHMAQAIDGSVLLPVQELELRLKELPQDREIVVYCRVGNRSVYAAEFLARRGYRVKNLEGGIVAWNRSGMGEYANA